MIKDYFIMAVRNIRKRKLRSGLTIIGIVIAVATIFVLISLSLGLQNAIQEQFKTLGGDKFFIQPKGQLGPPQAGSSVKLTTKDINVIEKVNGVKRTTYLTIGNAEVEFKKEKRFFSVLGIPQEGMELYTESGSLKIEEGRNLKKGEQGKIVIGNNYKTKNIFETSIKPGDKFLINSKEFEVVGIFAVIGNPEDDRTIMMSDADFIELFNSGDRVDFIIIQINEGENVKDIAESVEKKLRKFRNVDEKTQDFTVLTPEELLAIFGNVLNIITSFLGAVAAISLLVGAIGITNTMYTNVLERTREIGVMKAIGAQNKDILTIFLIESGLLGLVGGVIGILFGFIVGKSIEIVVTETLATNLLQIATPLYLIIGCLSFAFIIGAVAGTMPAIRASKINTVEALRYE